MRDVGSRSTEISATQAFAGVMANDALKPRKKAKLPPPFSIRFTESERDYLDRAAGKLSLASYIRSQLFTDGAELPRGRRPSKRPRSPDIDHVALGKVLGALGQSRLASNLNQIAKAANMGALPVTAELLEELHQACQDIHNIRQMLIKALGLKQDK